MASQKKPSPSNMPGTSKNLVFDMARVVPKKLRVLTHKTRFLSKNLCFGHRAEPMVHGYVVFHRCIHKIQAWLELCPGLQQCSENCKEKGMEDQPVDVEDQVAQGQLQTAQPLHWEIPLLDPSKQLTYKETFKNIQRKMMPKRPVLQTLSILVAISWSVRGKRRSAESSVSSLVKHSCAQRDKEEGSPERWAFFGTSGKLVPVIITTSSSADNLGLARSRKGC